MVRLLLGIIYLYLTSFSGAAFALWTQTSSDLEQLKELIRYQVSENLKTREQALPTLLAVPRHHWVESKFDFAAQGIQAIQQVFSEPGQVILCQECDTHRAHSDKNQQLHIHNGSLSLAELQLLKDDPRFKAAKSVSYLRETPSGVSFLMVSLTDGRILYSAIADSSHTLDDARPWQPYGQELDRRKRGESLYYVFINIGFFKPMFQVEWLEQWGSRNQHISGVMVSFLNPVAGIGVSYHYMLPHHPRLNFGLSVLYPLQNFASDDDDEENDNNPMDKLVIQGSAHYAIGSSFGVMAAANSDGGFSIGINLFNPIFMPFLF